MISLVAKASAALEKGLREVQQEMLSSEGAANRARKAILSTRRLRPDPERLLSEVIDVWAARAERLPVSWIVEECRRRARSRRVEAPSRRSVDARLRDRGLDGLSQQRFVDRLDPAMTLTPRNHQRVHAGVHAIRPGRAMTVKSAVLKDGFVRAAV